jgi:carbamoyl-phosphate synthase large subunit
MAISKMNYKFSLQNKRIFISGGAGVIGKELVKKLFSLKSHILVGDLEPRPNEFSPNIKYRQGDLNYITPQELQNFNPDYFFHLAATFERTIEECSFWNENFHNNVRLSNHLMNCLKNCSSLKKVVFASSYLIYNSNLYKFKKPQEAAFSINEQTPIDSRNLCGAAKLYHEAELEFLSQFPKHNFSVINARIFRSYGKGSRDIISRWIRQALRNEPLCSFGEQSKFDYIFAGDVAEGLIKLTEHYSAGTYNLGSGTARTVKEVIKAIINQIPNTKIISQSTSIPYESSEADIKLLKKTTKWQPQTTIESGIRQIIEHEKSNTQPNKTKHSSNILITSISNKIPLISAVKNAAKKIGNIELIYGADTNINSVGKFFVDQFWQMPRIENLSLEIMLQYCKTNKISFIIPTRDGELSFFSKHKNSFAKQNIEIMVSNQDATLCCLDKLEFYNFLLTNNIDTPKTSINIKELNCNKYVVKERYGAGSQNIGIGLDKIDAIEHAKNLSHPIFQEFIYGKEFSIDLYATKKKKLKGYISRRRNLVINGESQITTMQENDLLKKQCEKLAKILNLYGHNVIQSILGKNNRPWIIECNCRFGGASTLSISAGLDSFYWHLLEGQGINIDEYPFIKSISQLKLIRYKKDKIIDDTGIRS